MITLVCMYCKQPYGTVEDKQDAISHGVCKKQECMERLRREMEQ